MTDATEPVRNLWRAIAQRDWEAVKNVVSDDCIFLDVPFGPTLAARVPDDIVKRLKSGLENENLVNWVNRDVLLLTNGVDVMYEHLVTYTSANGRDGQQPNCFGPQGQRRQGVTVEGLLGSQHNRQHRMVSKLSSRRRYELGVRRDRSGLMLDAFVVDCVVAWADTVASGFIPCIDVADHTHATALLLIPCGVSCATTSAMKSFLRLPFANPGSRATARPIPRRVPASPPPRPHHRRPGSPRRSPRAARRSARCSAAARESGRATR